MDPERKAFGMTDKENGAKNLHDQNREKGDIHEVEIDHPVYQCHTDPQADQEEEMEEEQEAVLRQGEDMKKRINN